MQKIIIAITGATGAPLAIKVMQLLKACKVEIHLIMSKWGKVTVASECEHTIEQVYAMADYSYKTEDLGAKIASGSFIIDGMIVVPCSMKTLASIRCGLADNLITRAADVMLKEHRKLLLVSRETPLNVIHIENMLYLAKMGVMLFPPTPAFYNNPKTIDDLLTHLAVRILDQFNLSHPDAKRWQGLNNKE